MMQVINHSVSKQMNESTVRVNPGDVTPVLIKDRTGANEATVLIKGQEYKAQFEGSVPASDRTLAEVVGMPEKGKIVLRQASMPSPAQRPEAQTIDVRLARAGIDPAKNTDLKDAVKILDGKSIPLSKDSLQILQKFVNEAPGTMQEKMETVKVIAQKSLPVTAEHLKSIHSAMHGPALKDALLELTGKIDMKFDSPQPAAKPEQAPAATVRQEANGYARHSSIEQVLQQIQKRNIPIKEIQRIVAEAGNRSNPEVQSLKQEIIKALQIHEAGTERINQANEIQDKAKKAQLVTDGQKLQQISGARLAQSLASLADVLESEIDQTGQELLKLHTILKDAQKESAVEKMLQTVGKAIESFEDSVNLTQLKSSFEKAQLLSEQGRELAARKVMAEAVTQLEKQHPILQKSADPLALTDAEQYAINESLQTLGLQSKAILVTEISKKLSQMAIDFKKIKQDITRNLDNISNMIDQSGSKATARQMLDTTINKLDNAILKSNFMLYTDMLTEKKMLNASSRLTEARNLLAKGEFSQASQIVKEVKTILDQIIFKPSTTRVQNFVSEQSFIKSAPTMDEQLAYGIKQAVKPMPDQDYSSRQVFESLKRLGLTHENDAANNLVFGSKGERDELSPNLKSLLIKMSQEAEGQAKAEQALSNLTGQQLLNKQDPSGMQNLFMQMPFLLNQKMENIKVFINSQKSGEKIDWENCSLYFVLETKKLGEVGILVTAQNRNISITFNSNKEGIQQKLVPLTEVSAERLQEIGYKLEALKSKKLSENQSDTIEEEKQSLTPAFTEKGYDFTI
ncbi:hypothetical protein [Mesobacillus selenatarsenatis]|uniref:Flagellar hook-length control protein-like C-terminal domain-containing protein n=1 Tax=Mesobacillus selenatarsenatis TaxID=388741 RepID=A0A846TRI0_9BACI|nr:hypothetical protein [Mesobacillus selenatarsenatis]NKE06795.1 hypothetical protein [Mesobacillus selenatarsenatis]